MLPGKKFRPEDFLKILRRRFWIIVLPFLIIAAGAAVYARRMPSYYRAEAVIMVVPQQVPTEFVRSTVTARPEDRLQTIAQQILSRTRLERIIQDLNLFAEERRTGILEDIIDQMRRRITVAPVQSDTFRIGFSGNEPAMVAQVANRVAALFIEESLRDRENLADATSQFLESTLEDHRRRLLETEKKLEDYRRAHAGELPSQLAANLQAASNIAMELQNLAEAVNNDMQRKILLERSLQESETPILDSQPTTGELPVAAPANANGLTGRTFGEQLANARATLTNLQTARGLTDAHPDVRHMKSVIAELIVKADAEVLKAPVSSPMAGVAPAEIARRKRVDGLRETVAQIDRQLDARKKEEARLRTLQEEYQRRIQAAPSRDSELVELSRDYETLRGMYTSMLGRREESRISANLERRQAGEQFKLIDQARLPHSPVNNKLQVTMLGIAAGLGLGLVLTVLLEYFDNTFRTDDEVTGVLSIPVLAVVPAMLSAPDRRKRSRRRVLVGMALGSTVMTCVAVFAYAFFRP